MKFEFKLGVVTDTRHFDKTAGVGTNMFQVRIVPDMEDIKEKDLLPYFANFFKEEDTAYQINSKVWCLTNDDYTLGYILGKAQNPSGDDITGVIQLINMAEVQAGFKTTSGYEELSVIRMSGSSVQFNNVNTGVVGQIYNSKALSLNGPDGSFWISNDIRNPTYTMQVTPKGEFNLTARDVTEKFKSISTESTGASTEKVASKTIITTGGNIKLQGSDASLVAGNALNLSSGIGGVHETSLGDKSETAVGSINRTAITPIASSINDTSYGSFNITSLGGVLKLKGLQIHLEAIDVKISAPTIELDTPLLSTPAGVVAPNPGAYAGVGGGLCALPVCLFSAVPHVGNVLVAPVVPDVIS